MKKISIIIPVYNVELYLERCIQSAIAQDLTPNEYEIIIINDGSTDNSLNIINKYKIENSNIVAINQENKGVSIARNKGLDIARGDYILFLDGDDALYPNILSDLYTYANSNKLDLSYIKIDYFNMQNEYTGSFKMDDETPKILDGFKHQRRGFIFGLYNSETIKHIKFVDGIIIAEDAVFNIMVHAAATRVSYYNKPSYKYYKREGSALNSKTRHKKSVFLGYVKTIEVLKDYLNNNYEKLNKNQVDYFNRPFVLTSINALETNIIPTSSVSRLRQLKKVIRENELDFLIPQINKNIKYFKSHWTVFFAYHKFKHIITPLFVKLKKHSSLW